MWGHKKVVCRKCKVVIRQCRCSNCGKTTEYETCQLCEPPKPAPVSEVRGEVKTPKISEYHGCATGDCPHMDQAECVNGLLEQLESSESEIERLLEDHEQGCRERDALRLKAEAAEKEVRILQNIVNGLTGDVV